jgi:hypothetical protein
MNATQIRMAAIFNEWANRYADDPSSFAAILGEDGRPIADYGELCTVYFEKIMADLDACGSLPGIGPIPEP